MRHSLIAGLLALLLVPAAANAAGADALPSWAIGPFVRSAANPILQPEGTGWESLQAFNPGVVRVNGTYHMLYRGTRPVNISEIGMATSPDGVHFTRYSQNPVIGRTLPNETFAVEDPRLFYLDGTYYTLYTAFGPGGTDLNEATSTDLIHWNKLGPVVTGTKNGAVVTDPYGTPVKIRGQYVMYTGLNENFNIYVSPDLTHWTKLGPINLGYGTAGSPDEVCVAVTDYPIRKGAPVNQNILVFTAGKLDPAGSWFYAISEVLYSRDDLTKQLGRLSQPVLVPTASYEMVGVTPNTVFMNSILFNGKEWMMHYGAADTVTSLATASLRDGAGSTPHPAPKPKFRLVGRRLHGQRLRIQLLGATKGTVRDVRFYIGKKRVGVDRTPPFRRTVRLRASRNKTLELKAIVTAKGGRRTTVRRKLVWHAMG